jgi:hypothetical protein
VESAALEAHIVGDRPHFLRNTAMKRLLAAAAGLTLAAAAGAASAAQVSVSVGPELQKQSRAYGAAEVRDLAKDLQTTVQRALDRAGPNAPQRVDLVLEAAQPNRPTFSQLGAVPGLSMRSVGLGGAAITGTVTDAGGATQPLSYRWYETDLRNVIGLTTWSDADRAFDQLAHSLARGKTPNQGPYHPDLRARVAFDAYNRFR